MMGGSISVASMLGEGSTFTVEVPAKVNALDAAKASLKSEPLEATQLQSSGDGPLVLIIDDDAETRSVLG